MPTWSQLVTYYKRHQTLLIILLAYGATRVFSVFFLQLAFARYGPGFGDFVRQARLSVSGAYPFLDYWMEYPLIFPWLTVAAYQLSLYIPGDNDFWHATFYRWIFVPFDIGTLALIYALARRLYSEENVVLRILLLYTLCFITIYVPLGWFDSLPLFWLLLALYCTLAYRPGWAGIAAGMGFLTKLIPILVLPIAWQRLKSAKARVKLIAVTVATILLPMLPFILYQPQWSWAFVRNLASRPAWETVWALWDGYTGFAVIAPYEWHFDPDSATWASYTGSGSYGLWSLAGFALLGLWLWTRPIDWQDNRRAIAFTALTWSLFSLWSKGYSPQWAINFVPFVVLLIPTLRGAIYLVLLALGLLAEWPGAFALLPNQPAYFTAVILWRTALTVVLALEFGALALAHPPIQQRLRFGYAVLLVGLMLGAFGIGIRAAGQYAAIQQAKNPLQSVVAHLQNEQAADAGLVCRQIEVCEGLAPYLAAFDRFWFPMTDDWQTEKLTAFAGRHREIWLVETLDEESGQHNLAVEQWLSQQYGKVSQAWIDTVRLTRFVTVPTAPLQPVNFQFGQHLQLTGFSINQQGRYVTVALRWQSSAKVDAPYKLFVHLVDANGVLLAQNDQYPGGDFAPPTSWLPQTAVDDRHGLILPTTEPTDYTLRIGWYLPETGARLPVTAPATRRDQEFVELKGS